jgi:hypothetical protein
VLPALLFKSQLSAVVYLVAYGAGTVSAMIVFASTIALISRTCVVRGPLAFRYLSCGCSSLAIGLGGYWLCA